MLDSRWLTLGLATGLLAASACSSSVACGGPTSDFPFCDEPTEDAPPASRPGPAPGEPVDLDRDGRSDGVSVDGDADGDAEAVDLDGDGKGDTPLPGADPGGGADAGAEEGGSCQAEPAPCDGAALPLDVLGQTPEGALRLTLVELSYLVGPSPWTELTFRGELAGDPWVLVANLPGIRGDMSAAAPVGLYDSSAQTSGSVLKVDVCSAPAAEAQLAATLEVFEHVEVSTTPGGAGRLRGELRLRQQGFQLTAPFEITQACQSNADP